MHKLQAATDTLASRLAGRLRLQYLESCPSTQELLRAQAAAGSLEQPTLICTDAQPAGRGSRGRDWRMQAGRDLAFSLGLPLKADLRPSPRLPLGLAVIVAQSLANQIREQWREARLFRQEDEPGSGQHASTGEQVTRAINAARDGLAERLCAVKWPNDLLLARPGADGELDYRKCGGILVEQSHACLLIGIGLNVNSCAADFPPELAGQVTTLRDCCGLELDRGALFGGLAMRLFGHLVFNGILHGFSSHDESGIDGLAPAWKELDRSRGTRWTLLRGGDRLAVTAEHVDFASGHVFVLDALGQEYEVSSYAELDQPG